MEGPKPKRGTREKSREKLIHVTVNAAGVYVYTNEGAAGVEEAGKSLIHNHTDKLWEF